MLPEISHAVCPLLKINKYRLQLVPVVFFRKIQVATVLSNELTSPYLETFIFLLRIFCTFSGRLLGRISLTAAATAGALLVALLRVRRLAATTTPLPLPVGLPAVNLRLGGHPSDLNDGLGAAGGQGGLLDLLVRHNLLGPAPLLGRQFCVVGMTQPVVVLLLLVVQLLIHQLLVVVDLIVILLDFLHLLLWRRLEVVIVAAGAFP